MRKAIWMLSALPIVAAICAPVWADAPPSPDRAYIDAVIDALVADGIISADRGAAIKARGDDAAKAVAEEIEASKKPEKKQWYDTTKISGYVQGRWLYYPDAGAGEPDNEFDVRRARIKVEDKPNSNTKVEIQADLASEVELKDAWVERSFGGGNTSRVRLGQQKVPFGFETPQSSSVRLPLERNWVARRTISGERDRGLTYFYTDPESRKLFDHAKKSLYGTGDYGNIAVGLYNGQGPSADEVNSDKHIVLRGCKPIAVKMGSDADGEPIERYLEVGASYYAGDYYSSGAGKDVSEDLLGLHAYLAPEPWGLQAEYYVGETEDHDIDGFYVMGIYELPNTDGTLFARYDDMNGYRKGKAVDDSRDRWSIGYARALDSNTRLTLEYDIESPDSGGNNDLFGVQLMTRY